MDEPAPLHPNLARVAASYDLVVADWSAGRLDSREASRRLELLVARDDQGVWWRIDPSSGRWCRQDLNGAWVFDNPPSWGLQTPDGWEVSGGSDPFGDPRRYLHSRTVDPGRVSDRTDLKGATMRVSAPQPPDPSPTGTSRWVRWAAIAVVAGLVALGVRGCARAVVSSGPVGLPAAAVNHPLSVG